MTRKSFRKQPFLFKPGSDAWLAREAARRQVEAPWRQELDKLDRPALIEAAVSGAWTSRLLRQELDKVSSELAKHQAGRRSAAQKARLDQRRAKQQIRQEWLKYKSRESKNYPVTQFARRMVERYRPTINHWPTVVKWCGEWKKQAENEARMEREQAYLNANRGEPCPEVFMLLGFFHERFLS